MAFFLPHALSDPTSWKLGEVRLLRVLPGSRMRVVRVLGFPLRPPSGVVLITLAFVLGIVLTPVALLPE